MKRKSVFVVAILVCFLSAVVGQESCPLVLSQTISLPNMQGGFNHISADAEHKRLFAAAPTNATVEILDVNSGKPWRSLGGEKPAAARYSSEFNQLYIPRGQGLSIYDGKTFALTNRVELQSNLDELQYDVQAKQLYVGRMTAGKTGIAVIGIPEGKLLGQIPLQSFGRRERLG